MRTRVMPSLVLIALIVSALGCAGAQVKTLQAVHIEAQVVEAAKDGFAKLYLDDAISRDVYLRGRALYGKWAAGQTALAKSMAEWKRVGSEDSKHQMSAAITAAMKLSADYLTFIGGFVDIGKIRAAIEGRP